jgi:hypothetical protein
VVVCSTVVFATVGAEADGALPVPPMKKKIPSPTMTTKPPTTAYKPPLPFELSAMVFSAG